MTTSAARPLDVVRRMRRSWRRIRPFLALSRLRLVTLTAVSVAAGLAEAALLALIAAIANTLSQGETTVAADLGPVELEGSLGTVFAVGFGLALLRGALHSMAAWLPSRMSAEAMAALRRRLFDAFTDASWPVQASERDGHFQSLMTGHVGQASLAIVTIGQALTAAAMFLTLVATAIVLSPLAALALVVLSSALFLAMRPLTRLTRRYAEALSQEGMEYTKGMQDVVRLAEETQVYGATDKYREDFYRLIERVRSPLWRSRFVSRMVPVVYQTVAMLILLGALAIVSGFDTARLPSLTAVVLLLIRSLTYGNELQSAITRMSEIAPYMDRLRDAIDTYERQPRQDGELDVPPIDSIAARGVRFAYSDGDEVLRDLAFDVRHGEAIGIVGPSGAGKSTLVQLLLRLRDPDEGALEINGVDVRSLRRDDWQRKVAYVPQAPLLRWASVAENIRFDRPGLSDDDVVRAAKLAHIHDEIIGWPEGYDTLVGERAAAISGGQRQRLCMARALVARPSILILDEPTSALDVRSEQYIQESLRDLKGQMILFMVAHRLSTLSICDRVMVIVDGRLQAIDTPDRLHDVNTFYREAMSITRRQTES
jgi:ATP-binding cassette, subfamily B, bacterial